jgi:hypothetical protein
VLQLTPRVLVLPQAVQVEARDIEPSGTILYPYWLMDVRVNVKAPLLPRASRAWRVAIDGINGQPLILAPGQAVDERPARDESGPPGSRVVSVTPFVVARGDLDHGRLYKTLLPHVARRLRSWMNVSLEFGDARPVYKELRLFDVHFHAGTHATLALDTVTGEYGVAPPEPQRANEVQQKWSERNEGHAEPDGTVD